MGSSESYGRDFGVPRGQALEPGYEGEPPPERRTFWFYATTTLGALIALGLYTMIALTEIDLPAASILESALLAIQSYWVLTVAAPTVASFIMLIFKPTRGFATGFLGASAFGLLVCLAIGVFMML